MTNLEYAKTLTKNELGLISKVANTFIDKLVGRNASMENREKAYVKWCVAEYDPDVWYKDFFGESRRKEEEGYFYA